ncbi:MAG: YicC/YloC family endoribonuclease [Pirellulaceae bacterium]
MLSSMTGFGEATCTENGVTVHVEVRSVNNRHLKLNCRLPEGYASLEPKLDSVVRQFARRGSLQLALMIDRESESENGRLNEGVLIQYYHQLKDVTKKLGIMHDPRLDSLLVIPGVVEEPGYTPRDVDNEWPLIEKATLQAGERFAEMRRSEGAAMSADLRANCQSIAAELSKIEARAPSVIVAYEKRLLERVNSLLAEHELKVQPSDIVREVGIYADRSDISEEVVRLKSHLEQFDQIMSSKESAGRKLDFLIQELFREVNTIGSKANDAEIARNVVEIKTVIERLREMVQNIE